jgi:hypothetical protein
MLDSDFNIEKEGYNTDVNIVKDFVFYPGSSLQGKDSLKSNNCLYV